MIVALWRVVPVNYSCLILILRGAVASKMGTKRRFRRCKLCYFKELFMIRLTPRLAVLTLAGACALGLSACGHTIEQKAATGAVAGAVVAGPIGAAVGGAAGAAVGHAQKPH